MRTNNRGLRSQSQRSELHLFKGVDAQNRQALLQNPPGEIAEEQTTRALLGLGFENGTVFVKGCEMTGQIVEIVAEEVRAVFLRDRFEDQTEIEEVLGKGEFLGRGESDW